MALSLSAIAHWEAAVLASIGGASGTPDERDAQITRSGMYAEYPAIIGAYFELFELAGDTAVRLEALKRAVFLVWHSFLVPSVDSGVSELSETLVRDVMLGLDQYLAAGNGDDELQYMLAWYRDTFEYPFEYFGPVRTLDRFIQDVASSEAPRIVARQSRPERGQLGAYWSAISLT